MKKTIASLTDQNIASENAGVKREDRRTGYEIIREMEARPLPFGTAAERGVGSHGVYVITEIDAHWTRYRRKARIVFEDARDRLPPGWYLSMSPRLVNILRCELGSSDLWVGQMIEILVIEADASAPGQHRLRYTFRRVVESSVPF